MFDDDRSVAGRVAAGTAVVVTVISVLTGGFAVVPVVGPVDFAIGLAIPLGLWFGLAGAIGIAAGVVLTAAVESALPWLTLLDAVAYGGLAVIGSQLWGRLPGLASGQSPGVRSVAQFVEFGAVTLIGATTAAALLAWGAVIGWASPFYAVAIPEWALLVRSTLVVGLPVLLALPAEMGSVSANRERLTPRDGAFWGGIVTPAVWLLSGTAASLFVGSELGQIIAGGFAIALIAATYLPFPRQTADKRPPQQHTATDS